MSGPPFPPSAIEEALYWGRFFADQWRQDAPPDKIHAGSLSPDGSPQWTGLFSHWISNAPGDEDRHRTTSVMRRLRRVAPREYEVLYRTFLEGEPVERTTEWLNARARSHDIPLPAGRDTHYRVKDTVALMMAGIAFAQAYW